MKKLTLLIITLLAIGQMAKSQADMQQPLRFAFEFSPQVSWLTSDHNAVESDGSLMGYNFGVIMDKFFAPNYAFSTGLTINTTGGILKYNEDAQFTIGGIADIKPSGSSIEYRMKYLEIPASLKLQTSDFHRLRYYGIFGLSAQILIKTNDGNNKTMKNEVNAMDAGYHFGGGINYSIGGDSYVLFGVKYNQGFLDVTSKKTINDNTSLSRLVFNLGLIF